MENRWRTVTAGILDIVSGVGMLFGCIWLILAGGVTWSMGSSVPQWLPGLLFGLTVPFLALAILAVIGGIYSIMRKSWGMALTGAIAAFFCFFIFGAVSIVLTAVSRSDFALNKS